MFSYIIQSVLDVFTQIAKDPSTLSSFQEEIQKIIPGQKAQAVTRIR